MMMMAWQGRLVKGVGEIQLKPSYSRLVSRKCHFIAWVRVCQWEEADGNVILLMGQTHQNILTLNLTSLNFNYFLIVNFFRYFLSFLFFVCTFNTRVSDSLMSVTLGLMLDHGITRVNKGEPKWASESWTASEVCSWVNIIHIITKDKFQKWIKVFMWFNMEAF